MMAGALNRSACRPEAEASSAASVPATTIAALARRQLPCASAAANLLDERDELGPMTCIRHGVLLVV